MITGKKIARRMALIVLAGIAVGGIVGRTQAGPPQFKGLPVALTLKTDKKTYAPTDPILITFTAKNKTKSRMTLDFTSGQRYDFEIKTGKKGAEKTVWKWSQGMMFTMMMTALPLAESKSVEFKQTYTPTTDPAKLKYNAQKPLAPGTYTLVATLTTSDTEHRPHASVTFVVK